MKFYRISFGKPVIGFLAVCSTVLSIGLFISACKDKATPQPVSPTSLPLVITKVSSDKDKPYGRHLKVTFKTEKDEYNENSFFANFIVKIAGLKLDNLHHTAYVTKKLNSSEFYIQIYLGHSRAKTGKVEVQQKPSTPSSSSQGDIYVPYQDPLQKDKEFIVTSGFNGDGNIKYDRNDMEDLAEFLFYPSAWKGMTNGEALNKMDKKDFPSPNDPMVWLIDGARIKCTEFSLDPRRNRITSIDFSNNSLNGVFTFTLPYLTHLDVSRGDIAGVKIVEHNVDGEFFNCALKEIYSNESVKDRMEIPSRCASSIKINLIR